MPIGRLLLESKYLLEYLAVWPLFVLGRVLSDGQSRKLARILGRLFYWILTFNRRWCLRNLELVFGANLTPKQRTAIAKKSFEHVLLTCLESLRWTAERMMTTVIPEGEEAALQVGRNAASQGKGVIAISAHLGNFEVIPAYLHHVGWTGAITYRPVDNWRVEQLLAGSRAKYMPKAIPRGPFSLMSLLCGLREGQGVGILVDVNTTSKPVFVQFLGFVAASARGAATLALATGCPVVLIISVRQADGRHRLIFHPPFDVIETGNHQQDIVANTQQFMKAIEPYVLAHPEQYHWMQHRWRYRPDGSCWKPDMLYEHMAAERIGPPCRITPELPVKRAA